MKDFFNKRRGFITQVLIGLALGIAIGGGMSAMTYFTTHPGAFPSWP